MRVETEHQFLRRARRLSPDQALEAIEQRWQQLYQSDTIYHDDEEVNKAITNMIAYRKKRRFKTTPEWVHGAMNKMQGLDPDQIIEAINHHIESAHQGFFLPSHLKPKHQTNGITEKRYESVTELIQERSQRFDY